MARHLGVLIGLHRWRLDEQRRRLADVLRSLETMESRLGDLEREIVAEQAFTGDAGADADAAGAAAAYAAYARHAVERRAAVVQAIVAADAELKQQQEKVKECYRELRALELAEENAARDRASAVARLERLTLDEVALLARANRGGADTA